jgi:hypothetical protein
MFGIEYLKAPPTTYVLHYKSGKVKREGAGLSFPLLPADLDGRDGAGRERRRPVRLGDFADYEREDDAYARSLEVLYPASSRGLRLRRDRDDRRRRAAHPARRGVAWRGAGYTCTLFA